MATNSSQPGIQGPLQYDFAIAACPPTPTPNQEEESRSSALESGCDHVRYSGQWDLPKVKAQAAAYVLRPAISPHSL